MLLRFAEDVFNEHYIATIGVDFKIRTVSLGGNKAVKLQIWDTAGQERFRTVASTYYRGAHGIMVVYDVTNKDSFDNVGLWMTEIDKNGRDGVNRILLGNKAEEAKGDVLGRQVTADAARSYAESKGLTFLEVSAKQGINVSNAFFAIAEDIVKRMERKPANVLEASGESLKDFGQSARKACC